MTDLVAYAPPSRAEWQQTMELVEQVATTEFVPVAMRGKPGAVLASIMTGRELGIGPMQSLKHIRPVEGTPGLSAELMAGLVRSRGHKLRIITRTTSEAEVEGVRSDDPQHPLRVTWTLKDAERAGLCKVNEQGRPVARSRNNQPMPWEQYPDALLLARAISALCRALFSDVLAGFGYTPEELETIGDQTEATWGDVEVEVEESAAGVVTTAPTPAVAATGTVPTLEQIEALQDSGDGRDLITQSWMDVTYRDAVKAAAVALAKQDWPAFWREAPVEDWRAALELARKRVLTWHPEMSAADGPPSAAGTQSGRGRAEQAPGEGRQDSATTPRPDNPEGGGIS